MICADTLILVNSYITHHVHPALAMVCKSWHAWLAAVETPVIVTRTPMVNGRGQRSLCTATRENVFIHGDTAIMYGSYKTIRIDFDCIVGACDIKNIVIVTTRRNIEVIFEYERNIYLYYHGEPGACAVRMNVTMIRKIACSSYPTEYTVVVDQCVPFKLAKRTPPLLISRGTFPPDMFARIFTVISLYGVGLTERASNTEIANIAAWLTGVESARGNDTFTMRTERLRNVVYDLVSQKKCDDHLARPLNMEEIAEFDAAYMDAIQYAPGLVNKEWIALSHAAYKANPSN